MRRSLGLGTGGRWSTTTSEAASVGRVRGEEVAESGWLGWAVVVVVVGWDGRGGGSIFREE